MKPLSGDVDEITKIEVMSCQDPWTNPGVAGENHSVIVLVQREAIIRALGEFESRHVKCFGGFPGGGNRGHGDVGEDVAFKLSERRPCQLHETVIALVNGEFTAPIFFQDDPAHQRQSRGDGSLSSPSMVVNRMPPSSKPTKSTATFRGQ